MNSAQSAAEAAAVLTPSLLPRLWTNLRPPALDSEIQTPEGDLIQHYKQDDVKKKIKNKESSDVLRSEQMQSQSLSVK